MNLVSPQKTRAEFSEIAPKIFGNFALFLGGLVHEARQLEKLYELSQSAKIQLQCHLALRRFLL